jgi:hypothetical protein
MAQAIHVAAELGIADRLADGPQTSSELAAITGTHAPSLHRLLRALATIDLCCERADGAFELTALGRLLRNDSPDSLRSWAIWWGAHLWPVWGNLLHSVTTGKSARAMLTGTEGFKHLEDDPEAAAIFNQALVELTRMACAAVVAAYDFSGLRRVVDIGGGYGELLAAILRANPEATGVLLELPHALAGARRHLDRAGLSSRCEFRAGDFFASVPGGADAYLLKSVLHDWEDERSRQILGTCRRAMGEGARLLVVEQIVPDKLEVSATHQALAQSDLTMLVAHGARERTAADFRSLLESAGFAVARVVPAGPTFSVLEALPHR